MANFLSYFSSAYNPPPPHINTEKYHKGVLNPPSYIPIFCNNKASAISLSILSNHYCPVKVDN